MSHSGVGEESTALRFDNAIPCEALAALRLSLRPGREPPIKGVNGGQIKHSISLRGYYSRLCEESAKHLEELVGRRIHAPVAVGKLCL